jgi:hypothetical protein
MGYSVCPVCWITHDPVVLFHRFLQPKLTDKEFLGYVMCTQHDKMKDEYIALVECSEPGESMRIKDAKPTGVYAHVRRDLWSHLFDVPVPDELPLVFVEIGVIEGLKKRVPHDEVPPLPEDVPTP